MLTNKQRRLARAVFEGGADEEELCRTLGITPRTLRRWQGEKAFQEELDRLCAAAGREVQCILARFGPVAAARLVNLLESDKPDVARRAALDMIDRCVGLRAGAAVGAGSRRGGAGAKGQKQDGERSGSGGEEEKGLSDEEVRRKLLSLAAALAAEQGGEENQ